MPATHITEDGTYLFQTEDFCVDDIKLHPHEGLVGIAKLIEAVLKETFPHLPLNFTYMTIKDLKCASMAEKGFFELSSKIPDLKGENLCQKQ